MRLSILAGLALLLLGPILSVFTSLARKDLPPEPKPKPDPARAPTLLDELSKEPVAGLARAARERGDAARGAVLFFQPFLTCAKCHDGDTGPHLGPDVARVGKEGTAEYLIESVLWPSKVIKKGYETVLVTTNDGRTLTGLVAEDKDGSLTILDPAAGGKRTVLANGDIDKRTPGKQSLMPEGLANLLSDRQQFLDLAKYLIDVAEQGPTRAKELRPAPAAVVVAEYEKDVDHAGLIRSLDDKALRRGEVLYTRVCGNGHGTRDAPGSMPTSPRFAADRFKNGSDPHSLYQTLTRGYGMMAPQTWMVPRQKYDVIHYLRETYLRTDNASQYTRVDAAYLDKLPRGTTAGPPPSTVEPWVVMDYGPSLMNTYEVGGPGPNFAYKGIAAEPLLRPRQDLRRAAREGQRPGPGRDVCLAAAALPERNHARPIPPRRRSTLRLRHVRVGRQSDAAGRVVQGAIHRQAGGPAGRIEGEIGRRGRDVHRPPRRGERGGGHQLRGQGLGPEADGEIRLEAHRRTAVEGRESHAVSGRKNGAARHRPSGADLGHGDQIPGERRRRPRDRRRHSQHDSFLRVTGRGVGSGRTTHQPRGSGGCTSTAFG